MNKKITLNNKIILDTLAKSDVCLKEIAGSLGISKDDLADFFLKKTITVYTDGASKGNPGESGSGVVFKDGEKKTGHYFYNGQTTNNVAEYTALMRAVELCEKLSYKSVEVFSDSELMCNQINGKYKVNNEGLLDFHRSITGKIKGFDYFKISYIPREKNKDADKLANIAISNKCDGVHEF